MKNMKIGKFTIHSPGKFFGAVAAMLIVLILLITCLSNCSGGSDPQQTEQSPTDSPEQSVINTISFLSAGDNLIHFPIYDQAQRVAGEEGGYDFSPMYENIAKYAEGADMAFINQETALAGEEFGISSYPLFNSPQELGDHMVKIGFDIVNHANNHIMDKGEEGLAETLAFWKNKHPEIKVVGVYENQADRKNIRVIERKGVKFALLSYTYGTNGIDLPEGSPYVIADLDKEAMLADIERAKGMSDALIVFMHWGDENTTTPSALQLDYAQFLADNGVTIVIGAHPHVIQPVDYITAQNGYHMPVVYSLGNFISSQIEAFNMLGGMADVEFTHNAQTGEVTVSNVRFIPTLTFYDDGIKNTKIYLLSEMTDRLWESHGITTFDPSFSKQYVLDMLKSTIDPQFLQGDDAALIASQNADAQTPPTEEQLPQEDGETDEE